MSNEEIQGRNLISHGRFSAGWDTHWKHNGQGAARTFTDPAYGNYLMMNRLAEVVQVVALPVFTQEQMQGVKHRIGLAYENHGDGPDSKIVVTTSSGKEFTIDLSGKPPGGTLADWNLYPLKELDVVEQTDLDVSVKLCGPNLGGSSGLRISDVVVDVRLAPLVLTNIQLDDRVYEP